MVGPGRAAARADAVEAEGGPTGAAARDAHADQSDLLLVRGRRRRGTPDPRRDHARRPARLRHDHHTLWWAANRPAQQLVDLFVNRRLYIADGHHRYETALEYRDERRAVADRWDPSAPYEYVMALLVPADDPGLVVLPTHRLIHTPRPLDREALVEGWRRTFVVDTWPLPEREPGQALADELRRRGAYHHIFAALGVEPGIAHMLSLRGAPRDWHAPASWRTLDVGLLQALIVEPLERYPGTEVEFTRDPEECVRHAARDRRNLSLLLNATTVDQILAVARAGDRMPEKSTYFMPKVATGMVMYPLD
jgi:hypothetical protein